MDEIDFPYHVGIADHAVPVVTYRDGSGETAGALWLMDRGAYYTEDWIEVYRADHPITVAFKDSQLAIEFKLRWC
jgi:hypothetical protein